LGLLVKWVFCPLNFGKTNANSAEGSTGVQQRKECSRVGREETTMGVQAWGVGT